MREHLAVIVHFYSFGILVYAEAYLNMRYKVVEIIDKISNKLLKFPLTC